MRDAKLAKAWVLTAIVAGLTAGCLGSVAGGPGDAVDTDAATRHAGHDASPRDGHEAGGDARGHADAGRTADARAADVAVDATTVDASVREASSPVDAGPHDATQHVEAMAEAGLVDAGHDATADATDGNAAPVCAYPDAATGTMDILAEVPGVTIQDFDIDSANVFFTTSAGAILSCPASGCGATPTKISASIPAIDDGGTSVATFRVRIGLDGLVFAQTFEGAWHGGWWVGTSNIYTLGRDGGGVRLLQGLNGFFENFAVTDNGVFYVAFQQSDEHDWVAWLEALIPGADGGLVTSSVDVGVSSDSWNASTADYWGYELVGSTLYAPRETYGPSPSDLYALTGLADGGAATLVYRNPPVAISYAGGWAFAGSSAFVACSGEILGDGGVEVLDGGYFKFPPEFASSFNVVDAGGAYALFVCPSGATCPNPTKVAGVDAKSIKALYADTTTLYFTDTSNNLFSCDSTAALAGSCTPKLLSCPVPPFTELRSDANYVYLLKSDGSAIVRIAR